MNNQEYRYGWMSGHDVPVGLYVYEYVDENGVEHWGVDRDKDRALRLPSVEACRKHYLSKLAFPEDFMKRPLIIINSNEQLVIE